MNTKNPTWWWGLRLTIPGTLGVTGALTAGSVSAPTGSSTINNLTVTGTFSAPGVGGNYILNAYVSPATWSKPANLKSIKVTVVGAGGSGGNASTPTNTSTVTPTVTQTPTLTPTVTPANTITQTLS